MDVKLSEPNISTHTSYCSFVVDGIPVNRFPFTVQDKLALLLEEFDIITEIEYDVKTDELRVMGVVGNKDVNKVYEADLSEPEIEAIKNQIKTSMAALEVSGAAVA